MPKRATSHFSGRLAMKLLTTLCLLLMAGTPVALGQDNIQQHLRQADRAIAQGDSRAAITALDQLLAGDPQYAAAYYLRGREHFRLGQVEHSAADFDRYVELRPELESRQWERGIADYYAGDYEKGAKQFALYQTYHNNDVENAVWRYLCMAAAGDHTPAALAQARAELLPIENDRRVPMMQVYAMYRGQMTPEQVLEAAEAGQLSPEQKNAQLFYAHLYVGLFHAAAGNQDLERKHVLAAEQHKIGHYMWDVAHVHADQLRAAADRAESR
jgi:lipoprotein NlpI